MESAKKASRFCWRRPAYLPSNSTNEKVQSIASHVSFVLRTRMMGNCSRSCPQCSGHAKTHIRPWPWYSFLVMGYPRNLQIGHAHAFEKYSNFWGRWKKKNEFGKTKDAIEMPALYFGLEMMIKTRGKKLSCSRHIRPVTYRVHPRTSILPVSIFSASCLGLDWRLMMAQSQSRIPQYVSWW